MKVFPRVPKQELRNFIPNFKNRELIQELFTHILDLLIVLDALFDKHHDLLVVVVDVVVFEDLALGVVADYFQELFAFAFELLVDLFHDVYIGLVG